MLLLRECPSGGWEEETRAQTLMGPQPRKVGEEKENGEVDKVGA